MTRAAALIVVGLMALLTSAAQAQPRDPIDALLRPPPKDPDLLPTPQGYRAYVPPPPTLTAPVFLNETGKNPDAPATPTQAAYDSRLRASAASVQSFQGPMDGGWTLSAGAQPLYAFELTDRNGLLEGAWRDLRRTGALDASGFFDVVERTGGQLTFRFTADVVAVLHPQAGRWTGELTGEGRREIVSLTRRGP